MMNVRISLASVYVWKESKVVLFRAVFEAMEMLLSRLTGSIGAQALDR